jgi:Zn-dependent M32 family carboxypeptidase
MWKLSQDWLKGNVNITQLAKMHGLKRVDAQELLEEWKVTMRSSYDVREQAKDTLQESLSHYAEIKRQMWKAVESAEDKNDYKTKAAILRSIADIQAKEVEMLQKAGLYDDAALGDELTEMENQKQILIQIIKDVSAECDNCKYKVAKKLAAVTGHAEAVIIETVT